MTHNVFGEKVKLGWSEAKHGPMNLTGHNIFDDERERNRRAWLLKEIGVEKENIFFPHPVHGNFILVADNPTPYIDGSPLHLTADAVITARKDLCLCITGADCPTVFLYDPIQEVIAIVHVGWRNLASGIVEKTVLEMMRVFNCRPENMKAMIGPGLCAGCFEVKQDVARMFGIVMNFSEKVLIDLNYLIGSKLKIMGLNPLSVTVQFECTRHSAEKNDGDRLAYKYFSHRRGNGDPTCNQLSAIMMTS